MAKDHLITHDKKFPNIIDTVMFSVTIQAGVGITHIYPVTNLAKIAVTFQQLLLICTNVFMIYFILIESKEKFFVSQFLHMFRGLGQ
jgi:heme A synthase